MHCFILSTLMSSYQSVGILHCLPIKNSNKTLHKTANTVVPLRVSDTAPSTNGHLSCKLILIASTTFSENLPLINGHPSKATSGHDLE